MKKRLLPILTGSLMVIAPCASAPVLAQSGQMWIEPRIGWLVPTSDLGRTDVQGSIGFGTFERVDQSASLGFGVGVNLSNRWALRGSFDHGLDASVQGEWRCVPFVACPAVLLPIEGTMRRWTATMDAVYRPVTGFPVNPNFFAGIGLRRSLLDWNEPAADVTLPAFSFDEVSAVYRLGLGLERDFGRTTALFGEFAVMASRFGGSGFESIEGSLPADRQVGIDVGMVGGVRVRFP